MSFALKIYIFSAEDAALPARRFLGYYYAAPLTAFHRFAVSPFHEPLSNAQQPELLNE